MGNRIRINNMGRVLVASSKYGARTESRILLEMLRLKTEIKQLIFKF